MSDLEKARPGKVGKSYPVSTTHNGHDAHDNHAPVQQVSVGDRVGWVLALVIGIAALILAILAMYIVSDARSALKIAQDAMHQASLAIDRAGISERESRLAEEAAMNLRATMRAHGIVADPVNGLKKDIDEEEPVEP